MRRALLVAAALVALGLQLPEQLGDLGRALPVVARWADPDDQYRAVLGDVPSDLLRLADERMPADASVLLVTPGADVRHREYTTFHRALYFLAPRPVRWITPAPRDGTYEGEWWTPASLTPDAICGEARTAAATYLLLLDLPAPAVPCPTRTWIVEALPGGTLVALEPPASGGASGAAGAAGAAGRTAASGGLAPWWPVQVGIALAIPLLIGWALVAVALRGGSALTLGQRGALAWVLGCGTVTLGLLALGAIGLTAELRMAGLVAFGVTAGAWLLRRVRRSARRTTGIRALRPAPRTVLEWLLLAALAWEAVLVAILALGRPLSIWDGWAHWGMKARSIFLDGGVTSTIYADATRASTHLAYPLHVPLLESWVYQWLGTPDDRLVGVLGLGCFVALLALCHGTLRRWGADGATALALTAVLGSMVFAWRLAAAGFADVPLALLLCAAAVLLVEWLEHGDRGALLIAAAAAGLLGWTKLEGLALLAVLVALVGAVAVAGRGSELRGRARRAVAGMAVSGVALSGGWWAFVVANVDAPSEFRLTIEEALANLERLPTIVSMQAEMLVWPAWSLIWPIAALVAVVTVVLRGAARRNRWPGGETASGQGWLLPATAALYLAAMSGAYLVTTYAPYTEQIEASGYRLALQVLPVTLLWLGRRALPVIDPGLPPARTGGTRSSVPAPGAGAPPAASPAGPG